MVASTAILGVVLIALAVTLGGAAASGFAALGGVCLGFAAMEFVIGPYR